MEEDMGMEMGMEEDMEEDMEMELEMELIKRKKLIRKLFPGIVEEPIRRFRCPWRKEKLLTEFFFGEI